MNQKNNSEIDTKTLQSIRHTLDCYSSCTDTLVHCMTMGGDHTQADHLQLLLDCAAICKTGAGFLLRNSVFQGNVLQTCIEICNQCAESCVEIDSTDKKMQKCAEVCRQCADYCQQLLT